MHHRQQRGWRPKRPLLVGSSRLRGVAAPGPSWGTWARVVPTGAQWFCESMAGWIVSGKLGFFPTRQGGFDAFLGSREGTAGRGEKHLCFPGKFCYSRGLVAKASSGQRRGGRGAGKKLECNGLEASHSRSETLIRRTQSTGEKEDSYLWLAGSPSRSNS
jgi:hypothetical protein